ncbi:16S rRNA (cytosine967-C5)-methyltransferase [Sphingomonas sp. SORGH_AS 950]|uniref:RsmB/NOP family class I SAM-dependent RNA methyltransferase n=1 Tax=Sphingomonas sp. SORGH_AS_0950 TaxID=3041792 RepID=UPI002783333A|nr:RsmB/NOP family class I SAM-dependent RNA methyltransferase [Sphingomonas sp. SORGH_AS_0950]MDQ1156415.1 16S rRNA (cytosine967-C5)-methyltransferase [Sphingomonas sp. SORGH_AS_0950]
MTPGARTQAAIELLDEIVAAAASGGAAADTLIARYFATRRYAGSKDRRAVRELVYAAIRQAGPMPVSGRAAMLAVADRDPAVAATFDGAGHGPAPIAPDEPRAEGGVAPGWLVEALTASGLDAARQAALVDRAPLDLRVNSLATTREAVLEQWPEGAATLLAPLGIRLPNGTAVESSDLYRAGLVEVQDEGSQLVGAALNAKPGEWLVDLCAGAGGKTLQLAAAMANQGALVACDIDRARLQKLPPRAERAGASIIESRLLNPGHEAEMLADWAGKADGVLIDAPCSGTGTWRRNPEARWRLTPERLQRLRAMQEQVMTIGAGLVKPGGRMVYIVCSLLDAEGSDQVAAFLARHPGWVAAPIEPAIGTGHGPGRRLDPATHGTDGFFVACLRAPC